MSYILVDTTVWIDFFNKREGSRQADTLTQMLDEGEYTICICPIIYQEILQGIKEDKTFEEIKGILQTLVMIDTPLLTVADYAVDLYRSLRKKGITIRKPYDCLIASYALLEDIYLLHNDFDFEQIENNSTMKVYPS